MSIRLMTNLIARYTKWLHTGWPAGHVEKLPAVNEDGSTNVRGLYVVGDLTGVPLLKLSADSGARAVETISQSPSFENRDTSDPTVVDIAIVGGGVSGFAAALAAKKRGLSFRLLEAAEPFSTIVNFPRGKPIYSYPTDMTPAGELQLHDKATVKEGLLEDLVEQTLAAGVQPFITRVERVRRSGRRLELVLPDQENLLAHSVIVAIGRSGNFRRLGVPGEDLDKVSNRLHDPRDFCDQRVLVVGGGDSALETAIAVAECGANVTLSYRKPELSRAKPENIDKIQALARDPGADVAVEEPTSQGVTTAAASTEPSLAGHRRGGSVHLMMSSRVKEIREDEVVITDALGSDQVIANDAVLAMIGREAPLDFFRRSGVHVRGDWRASTWIGLVAFLAFCVLLYHWKSDAGWGAKSLFAARHWFPFNLANPAHPSSLLGTLKLSLLKPSFYYTLAYSLLVIIFGIRRIRRRRTPYVKVQTLTLMAIQCIPLFLLPFVLLPWLGHNGAFGQRHTVYTVPPATMEAWQRYSRELQQGDLSERLAELASMGVVPTPVEGWVPLSLERSWGDRLIFRSKTPGQPTREAVLVLGKARLHVRDDSQPSSWIGDQLSPASEWDSHGREYWRATGFILAWPLMIWNVFTHQPMLLWLVIGFIQTFLIIPLLVWRWGKGAYCGWICPCGALAETLGDNHRQKMPHGPTWNRVNMVGQVVLASVLVLLALRIVGWVVPADTGPGSSVNAAFMAGLYGKTTSWSPQPFPFNMLNYDWFVDLFLAGIVGVGLYFHFSGRVWCRFACPLAALMHIYSRFSRFRIIADKKKCISCNVCTSVCHQGIDIMSFANKGLPMEDPECVRCSACVQSCPTGVLAFSQVDRESGRVIAVDRLAASPVRLSERGPGSSQQR